MESLPDMLEQVAGFKELPMRVQALLRGAAARIRSNTRDIVDLQVQKSQLQTELALAKAPGASSGQTHYDRCWRERGHHACAIARPEEGEKRMELTWKKIGEHLYAYGRNATVYRSESVHIGMCSSGRAFVLFDATPGGSGKGLGISWYRSDNHSGANIVTEDAALAEMKALAEFMEGRMEK